MSDDGTRATEYAILIDEVSRVIASRIEEAELPLHVLLSSPFGTLNENQEELLTAARDALDAADVEIRRLRSLLALDRGAMHADPCPIALTELLKPALAIVEGGARTRHVTIQRRIDPSAARAIVDAVHVQPALTTLLTDVVSRIPTGHDVEIAATDSGKGRIRITAHHPSATPPGNDTTLDLRLAQRLIAMQDGTVLRTTTETRIELPSEVPTRVLARSDTDA